METVSLDSSCERILPCVRVSKFRNFLKIFVKWAPGNRRGDVCGLVCTPDGFCLVVYGRRGQKCSICVRECVCACERAYSTAISKNRGLNKITLHSCTLQPSNLQHKTPQLPINRWNPSQALVPFIGCKHPSLTRTHTHTPAADHNQSSASSSESHQPSWDRSEIQLKHQKSPTHLTTWSLITFYNLKQPHFYRGNYFMSH